MDINRRNGRLAAFLLITGLWSAVGHVALAGASTTSIELAGYELFVEVPAGVGRTGGLGTDVQGGVAGRRRCELGQGRLGCGVGRTCDYYRNRCVEICAGDDCCDGVVCPPPSVCASAVGRCGLPAGPRCFGMGTTWWTGRDVPGGGSQATAIATPVKFRIHNGGVKPLYFESTMDRQLVRFDLYRPLPDGERKLELTENRFCPNPCPAEGPVRELDCARPPRIVQELPAGGAVGFSWSGAEEVRSLRVCDRPPGRSCLADRISLPGDYVVEVCAHTAFTGGAPLAGDPHRIMDSRPGGERRCHRVQFRNPASSVVDIPFAE